MLIFQDDWTAGLLDGLPQPTIPATATGIARATGGGTTYNPTVLAQPMLDPAQPIAAPGKSFFDSVLSDVSQVLGAARLNVQASGSGVSITQAASPQRTIVDTRPAPWYTSPVFLIGAGAVVVYLIVRD